MISRINTLTHHVANQIAAGEVIERPASVVKELLENALDADAHSIQIDIGFGGLNHIIVSDNGVGIFSEDLPLAVAAHATSKLKTLDDLYTIETMGFRGEALASIASVSRVNLLSRTATEPHATRLQWDETGVKISPYARNVGTTVEIRDLFFNAPVRKKFLKSEILEFFAIETVVKRFALSEPSIALKLIHNGKQRLNLPSALCETSKRARLQKLFGKSFIDQALILDVKRDNMTLSGWVSHPEFARSQQDKQWIYINRRMVKDKLMMHAIKVAYEPLIHQGRHPLYLLYFNASPNHVDVNVHPTKHEVRFSHPRAVHDFIYASIAEVIHHAPVQKTSRSILSSVSSREAHAVAPSVMNINGWTRLNKRYAILFFAEEPYLVDMVRLRQDMLLSQLSSSPVPWQSRLLLVPVSIEVLNLEFILKHYQPILISLGFIVEEVADAHIKIRSIPLEFPTLDFHYFIQHLMDVAPTQDDLIRLMIKSDTWDLFTTTEEEKVNWTHAWFNQMNTQQENVYSLQLNEEKCEALLMN